MKLKRVYDRSGKRLLYIKEQADSQFWDSKWTELSKSIFYHERIPRFNLVVNETRRLLKPSRDVNVLEGGCGLGLQSWYLYKTGYSTTALDFTPETIAYLQEHIAVVNPVLGDVRDLSFADGSFDAYWSLGVIEHFYDGYDSIADEMHRVLKKNGLLFVTFPYMSLLRKCKAFAGFYSIRDDVVDRDFFYQYALNHKDVVRDMNARGFKLIRKKGFGVIYTLKQEMGLLNSFFAKIQRSEALPAKLFKLALEAIFGPVCSHCILLVFRKQ